MHDDNDEHEHDQALLKIDQQLSLEIPYRHFANIFEQDKSSDIYIEQQPPIGDCK